MARHWLVLGASGWRIDTMSDPTFPADFWQGFRSAVKAAKPDAPIIGEAWQRDQVLPLIRGDTADTITDYRSRTPLLAYLGTADARGFADDGTSGLSPAVLASELAGVLEDEPPAVAGTAFRLVDSHDTERVLWSLTPGTTAADKETAAKIAVGKARLRLAALMQFTLPGAPVVYYGDEVGMTGATDPENRGGRSASHSSSRHSLLGYGPENPKCRVQKPVPPTPASGYARERSEAGSLGDARDGRSWI